jgi:hypothetical protein
MGGRDGLADDWLSSSRGSGISGGWGLLLGGLSSLLSGFLNWLLGGLGRGLSLDGSTELGEWGLWLLTLFITCGSLLFLVQPWEGALALVVLDSGSLSSLGLTIGGRSGGGLSWDRRRRSDAGGL